VCFDSESDIPFIIFEALRPFSQEEDLVLCKDGSEPASIDMMQELRFTTENGVLYEYLPGAAAEWEFVSGPLQPSFTPGGVVTTANLDPGTYVFRYSVSPEINCGGNCPSVPYLSNACPSNLGSTSPCPSETAEVRIVVIEPLYAGEDTIGVELCTDGSAIDLISLLETNGNGVYRGTNGVWTDGDDNVVPNNFMVPPFEGQRTFDLTYTTTVGSSCTDQAMLNLTLYWEYSAGEGASLEICSDATSFNLFDILTGTKSDNGSWTGPNGYTATYIGTFDPASGVSGEYVYTVPANGLCPASQSTITVLVDERPNAGPDFNSVICRSETVLDLFTLLGPDTDTDGNFVDLSSNTVVPDGILDLLDIAGPTVQLEYRVNRNDECAQDVATVQLELTEVEVPVANDRSFCILEGATLRDVEVQASGGHLWYGSSTAETVLAPETVLERTTYYVANVDGNGCESERIPVNIVVYNIGETNACKPDLPDGVSPNGDGQNDNLDLGDLETAFPSFELSIYNRYGTLVYKGKAGTSYFSGSANVSPSLGDDLPSGVYFYVFEPNDAVNGPFQDSFYLSK
jgi:gliding motility-associated-like protein